MKTNKTPGVDNILNEVLKFGEDPLKGHLIKLFNSILNSGVYPTLWSFGLIVPIHKKDDPCKAENYRGITLLSSLSKLFIIIYYPQQIVQLCDIKRDFESRARRH